MKWEGGGVTFMYQSKGGLIRKRKRVFLGKRENRRMEKQLTVPEEKRRWSGRSAEGKPGYCVHVPMRP